MIRRITGIELRNFQGHKHTTLDTDAGVVVFGGESNNGKTSIMRALSWLLTNRPTGDGFVSHWAKRETKSGDLVMAKDEVCSVVVKCEDKDGVSHELGRYKTATANWYVVDGEKLGAVGVSVPKEVTDIMSMSDVNVQGQDDRYFLICDSPGQVASRLNELVHLDTIDRTFEELNARKRELAADMKSTSAKLAETEVKLDGLSHVPDMLADLTEAEETDHETDKLRVESDGIQQLLSDLDDVAYDMRRLPDLDICENAVPRMTRMYGNLKELKDNMLSMKSMSMDMADVCDELDTIREGLEDDMDKMRRMAAELKVLMDKCDYMYDMRDDANELLNVRGMDDYDGMDDDYERMLARWDSYRNTLKAVRAMQTADIEIGDLIDELDDATALVVRLEGQLPDTCPVCGGPLEGGTHGHKQ